MTKTLTESPNACRKFGGLVQELQSMPPPIPEPSAFAGSAG